MRKLPEELVLTVVQSTPDDEQPRKVGRIQAKALVKCVRLKRTHETNEYEPEVI